MCRAPCEVEVPNGIYELKTSDNLLFGGHFTVSATGGDQRWEVEDANGGLGVLGILGTGVGLGGAIGGGLMIALSDETTDFRTPGTALAIGGGALAAVGLWALIAAFGSAEQL